MFNLILDVAVGPLILLYGFILLVIASVVFAIIFFAVKKLRKIKQEEDDFQ